MFLWLSAVLPRPKTRPKLHLPVRMTPICISRANQPFSMPINAVSPPIFTDRSIHYKYDNGFDLFKVLLSVVVMKMVRSDTASSGVMFSLDTETGFRDAVFINAAYGLGENVVQGTIDPDSFYVYKPTFEKGHRAVLKRRLGKKELKMVFTDKLSSHTIAAEFTKNPDNTRRSKAFLHQ